MDGFADIDTLLKTSAQMFTNCDSIIAKTPGSCLTNAFTKAKHLVEQEKEAVKGHTEHAGKVLGNMCIIQAMFRQLMAGELRSTLLSRCKKSFEKKPYLSADAALMLLLDRGK